MVADPSYQTFIIDNGIDGAFVDTLEFVLQKLNK
jgi:hypothetical protein